MMTATAAHGVLGVSSIPMSRTARSHAARPRMIPNGTPMATPNAVATTACHDTELRTWERTNPIERSTANWPRRRWTESDRKWRSPITPMAARKTTRAAMTARMSASCANCPGGPPSPGRNVMS
jgi:hypothetical protein